MVEMEVLAIRPNDVWITCAVHPSPAYHAHLGPSPRLRNDSWWLVASLAAGVILAAASAANHYLTFEQEIERMDNMLSEMREHNVLS